MFDPLQDVPPALAARALSSCMPLLVEVVDCVAGRQLHDTGR